MNQIKVPLSPREWAEKRLQLLIDWNNDATNDELDSFIEKCGFSLLEEPSKENDLVAEIPTDEVEAVKYFLNQLPHGYRERALSQMSENFIATMPAPKDMKDAIDAFNHWPKTKEGDEFWDKVFRHYKSIVPLPPLPNE